MFLGQFHIQQGTNEKIYEKKFIFVKTSILDAHKCKVQNIFLELKIYPKSMSFLNMRIQIQNGLTMLDFLYQITFVMQPVSGFF